MKKFAKQKRDQLILVCILTLTMLAGLWFLLIRAQKTSLENLRAEKATMEIKVGDMKTKIKTADVVKAQLNEVNTKLAEKEEDMVSGDYYASLVNTVRKFKARYKLDIPQFGPAASVTDVDLLPKFPYKQVRMPISGTGYYEEIGRFIADFENEYSASRIVNLELSPYTGAADSKEKLNFRMEIVTLVASGVTAPAKPQ